MQDSVHNRQFSEILIKSNKNGVVLEGVSEHFSIARVTAPFYRSYDIESITAKIMDSGPSYTGIKKQFHCIRMRQTVISTRSCATILCA